MNDAERAHILHRARNYPYEAPHDSYTWDCTGDCSGDWGQVRDFDDADTVGRTPVLAFGSNRAPERLHQKFAHLGDHLIPVQRAWLEDFDVVYAAHITSYGAVPAMLQRAEGVRVEIAVTWLDDAQLPIMHDSEMAVANYVFAKLPGVTLRLDGGASVDHAFCYIGTRGHVVSNSGGYLPLLAVHGEGRSTPGIATGEALEMIRERLAPDLDPDSFIYRLVADQPYRQSITEALSKDAVDFSYPVEVLARRG